MTDHTSLSPEAIAHSAALDAKVKAAETREQGERDKLHATMCRHEAFDRVATLADRLWSKDIVADVEEVVARHLTVVPDGRGGERIALRNGDHTDPLTDDNWRGFVGKHVTKFFREGGAPGAAAARGIPGAPAVKLPPQYTSWAQVPAAEKIRLGVEAMHRRGR